MIDQKEIDIIDQYLHDKLKGDALISFNIRVAADPEFAEEVELMKNISGGIKNFGRQELKNKLKTIAKKESSKQGTKRIFYWSIAASLLVLIGFAGYFYLFNQKTVEQKFVFNTVLPPFKNADIKFKEYQMQADKGAVISYKTGTIITIPKDAFVDKSGKVIQGNVSVKYRELTNPEELFLAGIPMNYDSAGHPLPMQTAGVCELQVFKDDSVLNINPSNEINIDFASAYEKSGYSLLSFDTVSKKWLKKEYDTAVVRLDEYVENNNNSSVFIPRKANHSKPRFKLVYREPSKFPEFEEYKNYSFEVSDNEKNYNPAEANINWKSVSIAKDNNTGEYLVTFINPGRQVTYRTYAVFEESDYQVALNTYNRKTKEQSGEAAMATDTSNLVSNASRIKNLQKDLSKKEKEEFVAGTIYRTFSVGKPGLYCYSKVIDKSLGGNLSVNFKDENGNMLNLKYAAILDKTNNTILRYTPEEFKSLKFDTTSQNVMIAITLDNNFAYMKKEDFAKLPVAGNCTLKLLVAPKKPESSDEISALIS